MTMQILASIKIPCPNVDGLADTITSDPDAAQAQNKPEVSVEVMPLDDQTVLAKVQGHPPGDPNQDVVSLKLRGLIEGERRLILDLSDFHAAGNKKMEMIAPLIGRTRRGDEAPFALVLPPEHNLREALMTMKLSDRDGNGLIRVRPTVEEALTAINPKSSEAA